jgi:hypothetical protein
LFLLRDRRRINVTLDIVDIVESLRRRGGFFSELERPPKARSIKFLDFEGRRSGSFGGLSLIGFVLEFRFSSGGHIA